MFNKDYKYKTEEWTRKDNLCYELEYIWEKILVPFRHIKWAYQRIVRGWDDRICWSIDYWFLDNMPAILRQFAATAHSYPCDLSYEEWQSILEQMARCFELANDSREDEEPITANEFADEYFATWYTTDDGELITNSDTGLAQKYRSRRDEIDKLQSESLHHGLDLFVKYFRDLWD